MTRCWPRSRWVNSIAALLDTEHPVPGVTQSPVHAEIKPIAVLARVGGGSLNPAAGDLDVTADWGHAGKEGVTMPGRGRLLERARQTFEAFGNLVAAKRSVSAHSPARILTLIYYFVEAQAEYETTSNTDPHFTRHFCVIASTAAIGTGTR